MSRLTEIIIKTKEETKKYFQKKCQKKIEELEKNKIGSKETNFCHHCDKEYEYVRKGKRERRIRTSEGVIRFRIQQIQCKRCCRTYRPLISWLGLKSRQIITEDLLDKSIEVAIHTSYKTASELTKKLTGEGLSSRRIQKAVRDKSEELKVNQVNEPPKEYSVICDDSTKIKTGATKRGEDIHISYGIIKRSGTKDEKTGKVKRPLLIGDIISVKMGNKDNKRTQHRTKNIMSDGAGRVTIRKKYMNKKEEKVTFHRCNWHLSRMLGFALYNDNLKTKKERIPFVSKLANIVKYSFNNYKKYYNELIDELEGFGYTKAVKYLKNAEKDFYNTKMKPIMIDGTPLLSNSPVERVMREINRRTDIGVRWSQKGAEAMIRVRLHFIYNSN